MTLWSCCPRLADKEADAPERHTPRPSVPGSPPPKTAAPNPLPPIGLGGTEFEMCLLQEHSDRAERGRPPWSWLPSCCSWPAPGRKSPVGPAGSSAAPRCGPPEPRPLSRGLGRRKHHRPYFLDEETGTEGLGVVPAAWDPQEDPQRPRSVQAAKGHLSASSSVVLAHSVTGDATRPRARF